MKATVHVFLKPGVLDVQGKAVENALHGLGWPGAANVRVGRIIEFDLAGRPTPPAEAEVKAMCEKLLANTVIESYRVEVASGRMKAAVVVFPGSNCDRDCKVAIERSTGAEVDMVWHGETELPAGLDLIVLPGGFSYGDYLRCGAMAALSPVMGEVQGRRRARRGGGRHLQRLPGAVRGAACCPAPCCATQGLKYVCKPVDLEVVNAQTRFTAGYRRAAARRR